LYVSHDPATIKLTCSRAILLSDGKILGDSTPDVVLDHYNALLAAEAELDAGSLKSAYSGEASGIMSGDPRFIVSNFKISDALGNGKKVIKSGDEFIIECTAQHSLGYHLENLTMGLHIRDLRGYEVFGTNSWLQKHQFRALPAGEARVFRFKAKCNMGPGRYTVGLSFHEGRDHAIGNYKWIDKAIFFDVVDDHQYIFVGVARVEGAFDCWPVS
jgi:hypothetical protein